MTHGKTKSLRGSKTWLYLERSYKLYLLQTSAAAAYKDRDGTSHTWSFLKATRKQPRAATLQQRKERMMQSKNPHSFLKRGWWGQSLQDWTFYLNQIKHLFQWTICCMRLNLWGWTKASPLLGITEHPIGYSENKKLYFLCISEL